jgi:Ca-activated chloride channel family protein
MPDPNPAPSPEPAAASSPRVVLSPLKPALIADHAHTLPVLVRVQAPDADPASTPVRRPYHLSLVIDRSGSMSGPPLQEAVRCARHIVDRLLPTDVASLVTFDHRTSMLVPARPVGDRRAMHQALSGIYVGGNTDLYGGWNAGAGSLLDHASTAALSRTILLTDGNANIGELTEPALIAERCAASASRGVTTSTYGLGRDFNETLMIAMARAGGGNHYYGDTADDLFEPFAAEFDLISSLYARHLRLSIATAPGVDLTVLNDYPLEARGGMTVISLPDVPWGAEAWVMLELAIPPGYAPVPGVPLLQAGVTGLTLDRAPIAFPEAVLSLEPVSLQLWDTLAIDPTVHARRIEVEASVLIERARAAALDGRWDEVDRLIGMASQRFGDQPWIREVLAELEAIATERDQAGFGKEAIYSAAMFRARLAAKDEASTTYDALRESTRPRFLRRDITQGRKGNRRPPTT